MPVLRAQCVQAVEHDDLHVVIRLLDDKSDEAGCGGCKTNQKTVLKARDGHTLDGGGVLREGG